MHLDILCEGIHEEMQEFEKWWSTRMVPMPFKDKDGKDRVGLVQVALRERKMFSLIFPKEDLNMILNTLKPENCVVTRVDGKGTKQFNTILNFIRKILRLKKIPEIDKTNEILPIREFKNIRVVGLGIREDGVLTEPQNGCTHESL